MILMFQEIDGLTHFQKISLINRYISVLEEFEDRARRYAILYHVGHYTVTVGSLLVPALLSIQYASEIGTTGLAGYIYWITWIISLLVTKWNGILALFRVDKKYYFLNTSLEHLKSEMSQYINLSGRYGGHYTKGKVPTHANQLVYICHNIEKIKMKQVEEEYYKLLEASEDQTSSTVSAGTIGATSHNTVGGMFNPTPTGADLQEHQAQLARALLPKAIVDEGKAQQNPTVVVRKVPTQTYSQQFIQASSKEPSVASNDEEESIEAIDEEKGLLSITGQTVATPRNTKNTENTENTKTI